jgi:hypothetical protein
MYRSIAVRSLRTGAFLFGAAALLLALTTLADPDSARVAEGFGWGGVAPTTALAEGFGWGGVAPTTVLAEGFGWGGTPPVVGEP